MKRAEQRDRLAKEQLQAAVNAACMAAQARYAAMPEKEAKLTFSYELQGFVASMVDRGAPLPTAILRITELLDLLAKANDI